MLEIAFSAKPIAVKEKPISLLKGPRGCISATTRILCLALSWTLTALRNNSYSVYSAWLCPGH